MLLPLFHKCKLRFCMLGIITLLSAMLLTSCASKTVHPDKAQGQQQELQTSLGTLAASNIVKAISSNAIARHEIGDYVRAALLALQKKYSVDQGALIKQLNNNTANVLFYKGVYAVYQKRHDVAPEAINKTAIAAMLSLTDSESRYYDARSYREIKYSLGKKGVIGVVLSRDTHGIRVVDVVDGGSAQRAGVQRGCYIVDIDGENFHDRALSDAIILLRGKPGSIVNVSVKDSHNKTRTYKLTRTLLNVQNIRVNKLKNRILYISIRNFESGADKEILNAYRSLDFKPAGLILDLRISSGGVMQSVIAVGDLFLPAGNFLKINNANPLLEVGFKTKSGDPLEKIPHIAVLVSGATASSAEGLALQLHMKLHARIIGSRTAGSSLIQSVYPMRDGSAVKLTTGQIVLADSGAWPEGGLVPDVCIDYADNKVVKHAKSKCKRTYYNNKTSAVNDAALQQAMHYLSRRR